MKISRIAIVAVSAALLLPSATASAATVTAVGPSVSFAWPISGATVSGQWQMILTTTSSNVEYVGVSDNPNCTPQGSPYGTSATTPGQREFVIDQDSYSLPDGTYHYWACAADEFGVSGPVSSPITVAIDNCTSEANLYLVEGSVLTGIVPLAAGARSLGCPYQHTTGYVTGVIFYVDDVPLGEVTEPSQDDGTWRFVLDTRKLSNGTHTVRVVPDDGNLGTATPPVTITVENVVTPIQSYYASLGPVRTILGPALGGEYPVGSGTAQNYAGGRIYWSPATGAHEVHGAILSRYLAVGGPTGPLGFPATDELATPDGRGRFTHFARQGSIYWSSSAGAHAIYGAIRSTWAATGWERGPLGYPTTDEMGTGVAGGRYNHFSRGGSVYWTSSTGARAVYGAIRGKWASLGWERGRLGYPTTSEYAVAGGRRNDFQHGSITWVAATGAVRVVYR